MRALSVRQPYAELIARGDKKIEYRTWSVDLRGDLLIVASKGRQDDACREAGFDPEHLVYGQAVCIVELANVDGEDGDFQWHLRKPRRVRPFPVTGYASLYTVDDSLIRPATKTTPIPSRSRKRKPTPQPQARSNGAPAVVLVVDHLKNRRETLVQSVIEELGVPPLVASTSRSALALALRMKPDVVVIPARMPTLSGVEVLLKVQERLGAAAPRFVVLTDDLKGLRSVMDVDVGLSADPTPTALSKGLRKAWEKRTS